MTETTDLEDLITSGFEAEMLSNPEVNFFNYIIKWIKSWIN